MEIIGEGSAADGRMVALKRGQGYVLWDPSGARQPVELVDFPHQQSAIKFSSHGKLLAVLDGDH